MYLHCPGVSFGQCRGVNPKFYARGENSTMKTNAKGGGLLAKFGVIFLLFLIVTLVVSGFATYENQKQIYQAQQEEKLLQIADYLELVVQARGSDFAMYQAYILEHCEEVDIPIDFDEADMLEARRTFETLFAQSYPGRTLGVDVAFDELSPEIQNAFAVWQHEYFLLLFEQARDTFGLIYVYYVVPTGEGYDVYYVLDALREGRESSPGFLDLCGVWDQVPERHEKEWEAWDTGEAPSGYDTFDNEYGRTYAWYSPLYVGGEKLGLIGCELELADYNQAIIHNTLHQLGSIALVLLIAISLTMWLINRLYISKVRKLSDQIGSYAQDKDAAIAVEIEKNMRGGDEIATLTGQTSAMILELDNYMRSLMETTEELSHTRKEAAAMSELAKKDALTGVRNRNAYEGEVRRLKKQLRDGMTEFGIAVVDLNYLKRINDTYGHEQGNIAIRRCCGLICDVFAHSPVFRIGGDEFAVILENHDYINVKALVREFNARLDALQRNASLMAWERISAAIGYALYDPARDDSVSNVFKRADRAMYSRKLEMKAARR